MLVALVRPVCAVLNVLPPATVTRPRRKWRRTNQGSQSKRVSCTGPSEWLDVGLVLRLVPPQLLYVDMDHLEVLWRSAGRRWLELRVPLFVDLVEKLVRSSLGPWLASARAARPQSGRAVSSSLGPCRHRPGLVGPRKAARRYYLAAGPRSRSACRRPCRNSAHVTLHVTSGLTEARGPGRDVVVTCGNVGWGGWDSNPRPGMRVPCSNRLSYRPSAQGLRRGRRCRAYSGLALSDAQACP